MSHSNSRRNAIKNLALGTSALSLGAAMIGCEGKIKSEKIAVAKWEEQGLKGNINHSVCYWCYESIPLDVFAKEVAELGISAIDLLAPSQWDVVEKYGLKCSVATDSFASIRDGFNDPANHKGLREEYTALIKKAGERGIPNVICFSGNQRGLTDEEGIANCAKGLKPLVKIAEEEGVVLIMELLNSKVDHPDYQCDHTPWGVELCKEIGSEHFKLLYDIYHMQIMEGDIIATIREYHQYIAHYHTGGVPGRNEINDSQELFYPVIMKEVLKTGFEGYVAQEFIPTYEDKIGALKEGITICDV